MGEAVVIDTARAREMLEASGMDKNSARAVVDVVNDAFTHTAVTNRDLREAKLEIQADISEVKGDLEAKIGEVKGDLEAKIGEVKGEIIAAEGRLEGKIAGVKAELQVAIAESVNKTARFIALLLGIALALAALWSAFVPAIRAALGAP